PRGEWVCLEMMMQINTPGESDGEMAFWVNDVLAHRVTGMHWRDVPELGLNRANMSHYIDESDADRPNRISFDDFIVSTERIGCDVTPMPEPLPDAGSGTRDAGSSEERDAGATPPPVRRDGSVEGGADAGREPGALSGGCGV